MYNKALWKHHFKNTKIPLLLLYIINLFYVGQFYFQNKEIATHSQAQQYLGYNSVEIIIILIFFAGGLACMLVGTERTNGQYEALLSMPFSRRQIFLSKWLFGLTHLISLTIINSVLFAIILKSFEHSSIVPTDILIKGLIYNVILITTFYTVIFSTGTLTGNFVGQVGLSLFFIFLSPIILFCIDSFNRLYSLNMMWHHKIDDLFLFNSSGYTFYSGYNNMQQVVENHTSSPMLINWIVLVLYFLIFFIGGYILAQSSRHENNQMFLVFPKIRPVLLWCFTITVATFAAELTSSIYYNWGNTRIVPYYIGFFTFGALAYYFGKRMIHTKYRFIR